MKRLTWTAIVAGAVALTITTTATAIPMTATFEGEVSGSDSLFTKALDSFPVGTRVAFGVNYDENFGDTTNPTRYYAEATTGWMDLGASHYEFDRDTQGWSTWSSLTGYTMGLTFFGSGPVTADGGSLFGLFLSFNLSDLSARGTPYVGFGYPTAGGAGTFFSYLSTTGTFTRAPTAIPEPGTFFLSALGLFAVGFNVRSRALRDRR